MRDLVVNSKADMEGKLVNELIGKAISEVVFSVDEIRRGIAETIGNGSKLIRVEVVEATDILSDNGAVARGVPHSSLTIFDAASVAACKYQANVPPSSGAYFFKCML